MSSIESLLQQAFEDFVLSNAEKAQLRDAFLTVRDDASKLSFARNQAFNLVKQHLSGQDRFDQKAFKWLEQVVKTLDATRLDASDFHSEAYFSPGEECKKAIISRVNNAQRHIWVCVFTISDDDITETLLKAHQKGRDVKIITDNDKANDLGSDVDYLAKKGVPLVMDRSSYHMHHKFALIDEQQLINGSFNWTRSASQYNNENLTIQTNPKLIKQFSQKFNKLWQQFS